MRIVRSALKHGVAAEDIYDALRTRVDALLLQEDPPKWLYTCIDSSGRPLEINIVRSDDGAETIIHAMKLRKKYYSGRGEL